MDLPPLVLLRTESRGTVHHGDGGSPPRPRCGRAGPFTRVEVLTVEDRKGWHLGMTMRVLLRHAVRPEKLCGLCFGDPAWFVEDYGRLFAETPH